VPALGETVNGCHSERMEKYVLFAIRDRFFHRWERVFYDELKYLSKREYKTIDFIVRFV